METQCIDEDSNPREPGYTLCAECLARQQREADAEVNRADYLLDRRKDEE